MKSVSTLALAWLVVAPLLVSMEPIDTAAIEAQ